MGRIILDVASYELQPVEKELLQHPLVTGVIFFARNFYNVEQLSELVRQIRSSTSKPLLLAVDQEGGRVQRFKQGFTLLPAAQAFAALNSIQDACILAEEAGWVMAAELTTLDIDISFAPVLDLGHTNLAIGERSFHHDPQHALLLAQCFIKGMKAAGMCATGKHFPGHGAVIADSHHETPIDKRSFKQIQQNDLWIFEQLVTTQQLDAIMPGHIIYSQIDPLPASASPYWLKQILRQKLDFKGTVFSDDLSMKGADFMGEYVTRAQAALDAGCDNILVCNNRPALIQILDHLPQTYSVWQPKPLLAHKGCLTREELMSLPRWRTAHKTLSALAQQWQASKS